MITHERISDGLDIGTVYLAVDPNMESGTVCFVGDLWFYFGGHTAEEMTPEEYLQNVPKVDIVNEIYTALECIRTAGEDFEDEYDYYDAMLRMDKEWFQTHAESGAKKICCPSGCIFAFECEKPGKRKSYLRHISNSTVCPLEKYHVDSSAPAYPTADEIFALCGLCSNGSIHGIEVRRKNLTVCFDCPVKDVEDTIQENEAEAWMS